MRAALLILLSTFTFSCLEAQDRRPVRVLTWNIYMRPASIFWNGQWRRAKAIGEVLKDTDHDILLFQEAFGKTSRRKLRKALGNEFPHEIEPQRHRATVNSGLWVLSRHRIIRCQLLFFDDCLVGDCRSSKGAVLLEVEINGQRYQFINTHVQAEDGREFAKVRQSQFKQMATLVDSNRQGNIPQFILGDLNTDPASTEDYTGMLELLGSTDGQVSFPANSGLAEPATWHADSNDLIRRKWRGMSKLLDHALQHRTEYPFKLRRDLMIYTRPWSRRHEDLSDHYAISLTILP